MRQPTKGIGGPLGPAVSCQWASVVATRTERLSTFYHMAECTMQRKGMGTLRGCVAVALHSQETKHHRMMQSPVNKTLGRGNLSGGLI